MRGFPRSVQVEISAAASAESAAPTMNFEDGLAPARLADKPRLMEKLALGTQSGQGRETLVRMNRAGSRSNLFSSGLVSTLCASALLLSVGCSGESKDKAATSGANQTQALPVSGADAVIEKSWGVFVARNSPALTSLLNENPEQGWVKFYNRDYIAAQKAFEASAASPSRFGLARSYLAQAEFFQTAYTLATEVELAYQKMLDENATRLKKTDLDVFSSAVRALRAGDNANALSLIRGFRATDIGQKGEIGAVATVLEGALSKAAGDTAGADKLWASKGLAEEPAAAALLAAYKGEAAVDEKNVSGLPAPKSEYGKRLLFLAQVRNGALEAAAETAAGLDLKAPDTEETVTLEDGTASRKFTDPVLLQAYALYNARKALKALDGLAGSAVLKWQAEQILGLSGTLNPTDIPATVSAEGLPLFLFSRYATPEDLKAAVGKAEGPGVVDAFLAALGPVPEQSEEGKDTRQVVLTAQSLVDAGRKTVGASQDQEGRETVSGLKILENDVNIAIRARAEQYRVKGKLLEALFLLEHTLDKENSKVGFQNDPLLLLSITRVYCALGRYREALNYSYRLVEARPELWLIQENLGNLSVLDNVDRAGRTGGQD